MAKNIISILTLVHAALLFLTITNNSSSSARTLTGSTPSHHTVTFLMRNVLNGTSPSRPATAKVTGSDLPFPKPLGLFPPSGGIPLSQPDTPDPTAEDQSTNTLGISLNGLSFPTIATLQELELGTVTHIDEEMLELGSVPRVTGKAEGLFVASSEDGNSHMMAMAAYFGGPEFKDGLRFFGVHRRDALESHIAVIGGTGQYSDANGYASIKAVTVDGGNMYLLFTIYLS